MGLISPSIRHRSAHRFRSSAASETLTEHGTEESQVLHTDLSTLPEGSPKGYYVVKQYDTHDTVFDWSHLDLKSDDVDRLGLTPSNVTVPVALMMLDPEAYPSVSRARKACRQGTVILHRGPLKDETAYATAIRGRVGDRVYPGDVLAKQVRMGSGYFPILAYKKPPFDLPVIMEDDHFALVNKPAGIVVYRQGASHGTMTIRAALPFVLQPPTLGTYAVLRRPASVHRLDKPTSGILCVAKTKPVMLELSRQFHDRIIKKTYFAIVNGIPEESSEATITSAEAFELGVDVDPNDPGDWQLIDEPLDEKQAVTVWRAVRYARSLHAHDGYLTLVELKPKTGRYHQLRRHMSQVCNRPLVGDDEYDNGTESAMKFRERGLFLCSSRVQLEHPYFNTPEGRTVWDSLSPAQKKEDPKIWVREDDRIMITAEITLPEKFESLLRHEEERYNKFNPES